MRVKTGVRSMRLLPQHPFDFLCHGNIDHIDYTANIANGDLDVCAAFLTTKAAPGWFSSIVQYHFAFAYHFVFSVQSTTG